MLAASPELCACYTQKEAYRALFNQPLNKKEAEEQLQNLVKKYESSLPYILVNLVWGVLMGNLDRT
jgi:hypothetical protein